MNAIINVRLLFGLKSCNVEKGSGGRVTFSLSLKRDCIMMWYGCEVSNGLKTSISSYQLSDPTSVTQHNIKNINEHFSGQRSKDTRQRMLRNSKTKTQKPPPPFCL